MAHSKAVPPPVNLVLNHPELASVREDVSPSYLVGIIREEIQGREPSADSITEAAGQVAAAVARRAAAMRIPRRDFVNASGIIIHTGWGNAPLHPAARERLMHAAGATPTGAAGTPARTATCATLLRTLTGAEAATITTQNAASLLLVAGALAAGREIVVAARDLVEISQGARIADILRSGGARVVAVGSANCVNIEDFRRAVTPQTAMLMRIHVSNVASSGYLEHVASNQLIDLARTSGLVYVENLGGGSLVDLEERGLPPCPTLQRPIAEGADLVLASGDKIIGGPQSGIIIGRQSLIREIAKHHLARTCRCGKLTLAALEATLAVYLAGRAWSEIPTLQMLGESAEALRQRANALAEACRRVDSVEASVEQDTAECGGAVLPGVLLPTWTVRLKHGHLAEDEFHNALLARGVVSRRGQGAVILDLRSLSPQEDPLLLRAVQTAAVTQ